MIFLKKAWEWIKKWWKLLVGFLLALGGIGVGIAIATRKSDPPSPPDLDDEMDETLDEIEEANRRKAQRLAELEAKNQKVLTNLSEDQQKEYEKVKDRPIEEVARWIDEL